MSARLRFASFCIFCSLLGSPAICLAQSNHQPAMQVFNTTKGTPFGLFGEKSKMPAPTVFVLAAGIDDERVSTTDCLAVAEKFRHAAKDSDSVALLVRPTNGHEPIKDAYSLAAEFIRKEQRD